MTRNRSVFLGVLAVITLLLAACDDGTTIDNTDDGGYVDNSIPMPSAITSQAQFTADMLATMEKLRVQADNISGRYRARINTSGGVDNSPTGNFSRSVATAASSICNLHNAQWLEKNFSLDVQDSRERIEGYADYIYNTIGSYVAPYSNGQAKTVGAVYEQYVNEIVPAYTLTRALATRNVLPAAERAEMIAEVTPLLSSLRAAEDIEIPAGNDYGAIAQALHTVIRGKAPTVMGAPAQQLFDMLFSNGDWCNYIDDAAAAGLSTLMWQN